MKFLLLVLMTLSVSEFRAMVADLASASRVLTPAEERDVYRLAWLLKTQQRRNVSEFLTDFEGLPVLLQYQSDGWGAQTRGQFKCKVGGRLVMRSGDFRHEYCLQRTFYKAIDNLGHHRMVTLLAEPLGLHRGRDACFFSSRVRESRPFAAGWA